MLVYINGKETDVADRSSVAELLSSLKLDPKTSLVERNEEIVPRKQYAVFKLADGDKLEILTIVGGG